MADRRAELERKKQKLAEIRALKEARGKTQSLHTAVKDDSNASESPLGSSLGNRVDAANEILASLGIGPVGDSTSSGSNDAMQRAASALDSTHTTTESLSSIRKPLANLAVVNLPDIIIPPKESVTYNKQTQTNGSGSLSDSPYGNQGKKAAPTDYYEWDDEFQVLTYDDVNVEEDGEGSSIPYGTPPQSYRQHHKVQQANRDGDLPHVEMVKPAQTQLEIAEEKEKEKPKPKREFSEEEKAQILLQEDFQKFFNRATRIIERALFFNEAPDIFIDYSGIQQESDREDKRGINVSLNRCFYDERWSKNRTVTSFDWSTQYPELLLASYNNNEDAPNEPDGVCMIWNMRFKKTTPEYVFHCQSPVMSACFAKFHPNLIVGGTYSGQIVLWDNRSNKKTPVQRSPLSAAAHTHPIYCIKVVGTQNAHNLITISTDGKLCSWSLDMLSVPQDTLEMSQHKQSRPVAVTCASFPESDFNNFIIGSEEGTIYSACRHGSKAGISDLFEGHQGPITGLDCHPVQSQIDFSHLFLTSSIDWTVKLWSAKEKKAIYSFEDNCDYLYDVRWSPTHPALFATVDGTGRLDLWNLNNDTELPTASVNVEGSPALNRIIWTPSGNQVAIGDDAGKIWIYDIGEQLATPKGDESSKFMHTLQELKNNNMEPEAFDAVSDTAYSSLSSASFTSPMR